MVMIQAIKAKKELQSLDEEFVQRVLEGYYREHPKKKRMLIENSYNLKSSVYKEVVKEVRARLREVYGVFQKTTITKRYELLQQLGEAKGRGAQTALIDELLASHQSTNERRAHYKELYAKLFAVTGVPMSVLDVGCGLNPLSYQWLGCTPSYTATEISSADVEFLNKFFEQEGITGRALVCDLLEEHNMPEADVCFMFKLIDTLEGQKRHISKMLIEKLKCTYVIASFPTVSIGGKQMRSGKKENWFSRFLEAKKWTYHVLSIPGEEFWIIQKTQ